MEQKASNEVLREPPRKHGTKIQDTSRRGRSDKIVEIELQQVGNILLWASSCSRLRESYKIKHVNYIYL
ncbi:MAG: hypothetical protein ACREDL_14535, partial [Bradyrhizobium sp.]